MAKPEEQGKVLSGWEEASLAEEATSELLKKKIDNWQMLGTSEQKKDNLFDKIFPLYFIVLRMTKKLSIGRDLNGSELDRKKIDENILNILFGAVISIYELMEDVYFSANEGRQEKLTCLIEELKSFQKYLRLINNKRGSEVDFGALLLAVDDLIKELS